MDKHRLCKLLEGCLSKKEDSPDTQVVVMHNTRVAVNMPEAYLAAQELKEILSMYYGPHRLCDGPSYIEVGAVIGSQRIALLLFAVGKVLGFWDIVTPEDLGIEGEEANQLAGSGFIMIGEYNLS